MFNQLLFLTRAGFENDLNLELQDKLGRYFFGYSKFTPNSGILSYFSVEDEQNDDFPKSQKFDGSIQSLSLDDLIFARTMMVASPIIELDINDRVGGICLALKQMDTKLFKQINYLQIETADTNQAKELSKLCRKLNAPMINALKNNYQLKIHKKQSNKGICLHLIFHATNQCQIAYSYNHNNSKFNMGIMRLKFPFDAPSRSTLKLDEAFLTFEPHEENSTKIKYAADLGACPGGWSYQLVKRGFNVYAVDHGKMAQSLLDTNMIIYCPADGFHFKPPRKVDIVVCDMAQKPILVAKLMTKWLSQGLAKKAIFNLKLPMKARYKEVVNAIEFIENNLKQHNLNYQLKAKQLYHNREEVTLYIKILANDF